MKLITHYYKKLRIACLRVALLAIAISGFLLPNIEPVTSTGDNIFTLVINGEPVGTVEDADAADHCMSEARRIVAGAKANLLMIEAKIELVGSEVLVGKVDDENKVIQGIADQFKKSIKETMQHSYTVKIDEYMVNVSSAENVVKLLEASIYKYDTDKKYQINLVSDSNRELSALAPDIVRTEAEVSTQESATTDDYLGSNGVYKAFEDVFNNVEVERELDFDDYDYGITNLNFGNTVEVVEAYLPSDQVTDIATAIEDVTKDKEQKTIYEVVSGDTLSKIASDNGITIDELIALNESLLNENSIIRVGDELTITIPEPELSVERDEIIYYEGTYEAETQYVYNDSWYTTQEVILQDPSSGFHKAVQKVSYRNNEVLSMEIIKEEVVMEAIPKIIEKGTKIPPTYIKPISGGRLSSGFGYRQVLISGMTSYHSGVDWATPVGTSVVASSAGTVTKAGWGTGYGYCIYIKHADGRETRYAHLSKVLVSVGQYVSQGTKIALSGNTGVSTGPHIHFEMIINGVRVNPLKYLN